MSEKISVSDLFSQWARNGRSDSMAKNHAHSVAAMLSYLPETEFHFLDIGCGNGWVCRQVAQLDRCLSATGLDVAAEMIALANERKQSGKETYIAGDVLTADLPTGQEVIFAMESLYYLPDLPAGLERLASLLTPSGRLIFGADYHQHNPESEEWSQKLGVTMHYLSDVQWCEAFTQAGLTVQTCRFCKDPDSTDSWHRDEKGTLIIVAAK